MELFSASAIGVRDMRPLVSIVRGKKSDFNQSIARIGQKTKTAIAPISTQKEIKIANLSNAEDVNIDINNNGGGRPKASQGASSGSGSIDIKG
ncbi:MAG: hypothetical protein HY606_11680 [Planctomycetes bacterium]|nr:hypothetical protein [Planctomycetota bacterium]